MYASAFSQTIDGEIKGAVFIDVSTPCNLTEAYAARVKKTISDENWKMLKLYKPGLYYVLKQLPEISKYMTDRFLSKRIPLTVIGADRYKPAKPIGETVEDMTNWKACLKELGSLPNHKYVATKNTDHKVWENAPEVVIKEISELYGQVKAK